MLEKLFDYNLSVDTITVTCNYDVLNADLLTEVVTDTPTLFTKPSLFVIDAVGTNIFTGISATTCNGVLEGTIFYLKQGSMSDSNCNYDDLIAYRGGVYYMYEDTQVTSSQISATNISTFDGGVYYMQNSTTTACTA